MIAPDKNTVLWIFLRNRSFSANQFLIYFRIWALQKIPPPGICQPSEKLSGGILGSCPSVLSDYPSPSFQGSVSYWSCLFSSKVLTPREVVRWHFPGDRVSIICPEHLYVIFFPQISIFFLDIVNFTTAIEIRVLLILYHKAPNLKLLFRYCISTSCPR